MKTRSATSSIDTFKFMIPHANEDEEAPRRCKWTKEEEEKLLYCLKLYGHKELEKIAEELPTKSVEQIKKYLTLVHSQAHKKKKVTDKNSTYWLNKCVSETEKNKIVKHRDSHQVAQIIKFLSVDGLLENHPLPQNCEGIDFSAAYKLLYQALMGYAIQPVNEATADFILQCFGELSSNFPPNFITDLTKFLKTKFGRENIQSEASTSEHGSNKCDYNGDLKEDLGVVMKKKPLNVYQRKRLVSTAPGHLDKPPLKIVLEEKGEHNSGHSKLFSIAVEGSNKQCVVNVPVALERSPTQLEQVASDLQQKKGFNPLGIPESFLRKSYSS